MIYLDNSATTKPYDEVIEAVAINMRENFGNPSSVYRLGIEAEKKLNECRSILASTINCSKEEIIFTSGGSESNNFALKGFIKPGSHIITSTIEHSSVIATCEELEREGVRVTYIEVDEKGKLNLSKLEESIDKDTVLVTIMHVNNEIGVIQDLEAIGKIIKEKSSRAKFHVDAVQSYGKLNIDVKKCNIDLLSVSGHKIHGPRGIGFLYIKKGLVPKPLIQGGGQEKGHRAGTENVAAAVGLTVASEKMHKNLKSNYDKVKETKGYFIEKLRAIEHININSALEEDFTPYILSVSFKGVRGEVLLHALENEDIYVSTGSACSSKTKKYSRVLTALGLSEDYMEGTIRFSFNEENTKEEIDHTINALEKSLKFLRRVGR